MFWADEVAKCNYKEFGDIVSFDATFNSNKYNMKFIPFIGIDNHGKCVTLGSRMLLHEDTKSYTWLLNAFMTAFSNEPTMIVTDQDGAMKRAIEAVFKKAKHRLCMWHIMQKIPSKTVTAVNDGLNIVCISCGLDVFLHFPEKCDARHALSRKSSVKRALFTSPVAAKSKDLGATSVVAKSRFSVAKTPTSTNKVSSVSLLLQESS
nr:protein FAR1-related sequence 5-like [Tanacetum cinerariifolium]